MRWLLLVCALALVVACGTPPRQVTMDGSAPASGTTIDPIYLWDNYRTRHAITGHARHGEAAALLQQNGDGCEVRTASGQRGWVTCANFIREFKH